MIGQFRFCLLFSSFILALVSLVESTGGDEALLQKAPGVNREIVSEQWNVFFDEIKPPAKFPHPHHSSLIVDTKNIKSSKRDSDHRHKKTISMKQQFKGALTSSSSRNNNLTLSNSIKSPHGRESKHFLKHNTSKHSRSHHKDHRRGHQQGKHTRIQERQCNHTHKTGDNEDNTLSYKQNITYNSRSPRHTPEDNTDRISVQPESLTKQQTRKPTSKGESTCTTCTSSPLLDEESVKKLRVEMFVNTLAQKLEITPEELTSGHSEAPPIKLPFELIEQRDAPGTEADGFYAEEDKKFITGHDLGRNCIHEHATGCYTFEMEAGMTEGGVSLAKLWVYKNPDRNDGGGQTFLVYGLTRRRNGAVRKEMLIQRHDSYAREGWIEVDVSRWMNSQSIHGRDQQMIGIKCKTCAHKSHRALFGAKQNYKPLLELKKKKRSASHQSRSRRQSDHNCNARVNCCKRSLVINFPALNLTRIISPSVLNVNYCYGGCSGYDAVDQAYDYTIIKHHHNRAVAGRRAQEDLMICCVPVALTGQSFWMDNNVQLAIPNLVVDRCGCL